MNPKPQIDPPNSGGKGDGVEAVSEQLTRDGTCPVCNTPIHNNVSADDLLDRIKVLEGERDVARRIIGEGRTAAMVNEIAHLKSILRRIPLGKLRTDDTREVYLEMCCVLGVDPDKPWEEK